VCTVVYTSLYASLRVYIQGDYLPICLPEGVYTGCIPPYMPLLPYVQGVHLPICLPTVLQRYIPLVCLPTTRFTVGRG